MAVSIVGIIINVIMVLIIITLIVLGSIYSGNLTTCEREQSPFCYSVQCPCDAVNGNNPQPPCFGYAVQDLGNNRYRCSNAPYNIVDQNGNPV
jgi:hypothetical protein